MELQGKLVSLLPETSGESARGTWFRGGFVIETSGDYPKKIAIQCFGQDRINEYKAIPLGTSVIVSASPESREYPAGTNKWFTNINCIRVFVANGQAPQQFVRVNPQAQAPQVAPTQAQPANNTTQQFQQSAAPKQAPMKADDDLPF